MTKRRTHPGDTGDSRQLALSVGRGELDKWLAARERWLAVFEKDVETCRISMRRGRWIEANAAAWAERTREAFAAARREFGVPLAPGGGMERMLALEMREAAAFARLSVRAAEERARGWPLRTLRGARPEVG